MASSGKHQWYVGEDGFISIGKPATNVTYHSALNAIIVTTEEPSVNIYDVTSGSVLQKSDLSGKLWVAWHLTVWHSPSHYTNVLPGRVKPPEDIQESLIFLLVQS